MPEFTQLFFKALKFELNEEEQQQLDSILCEIYNDYPIYYEKNSDFELCKAQLLTLLNHIAALNPVKLALFTRYGENVSKLLPTHSQLDIESTLKAAKKSIETSLLAIRKNHDKADKAALDSLVVHLCYSGAFSSIDYALGYFHIDALSFYIETIKSQLLLELSQQFLQENNLVEYFGDDTHYASGLYNVFAPKYGVRLKEDPLGRAFSLNILMLFSDYLDKKFTINSFLHFFATLFPLSPEEEIENGAQLEKLTSFFEVFEKEGLNKEKYLRLYDEVYKDGITMTLTPKPGFSLYYMALLASYFMEKGYLNNLQYQIDGQNFLYTGDALIGINAEGTYRLLTDEELLQPQMIPLINSLSLWAQLTTETLLKLYQEDNNVLYFRALLTKPLPKAALKILLEMVMSNEAFHVEQSQLANYIFTNADYELTLDQLKLLAKSLTASQKNSYIAMLTRLDRALYVESLLQDQALLANFREKLPAVAATHGAINIINLLNKLDISLDQFDEHGLSPACYAVVYDKIEILDLLNGLDVDLDEGNNEGRTPSHFAAWLGKLSALTKLHDLEVDLNVGDNNNATLVHYAAQQGHVDILIKLHELGIELNSQDTAGYTPAFYARVNNQVAFADKLKELRQQLKKYPFGFFENKEEEERPPINEDPVAGVSFENFYHQ